MMIAIQSLVYHLLDSYYEQQKQITIKKPSDKNPSTNTKTDADLAMKILAQLSPDQQAAIMLQLKLQAS